MKIIDYKNETWYSIWIILIVLSPILSLIGGYGYFYVLALLYPLAQFIALNKKEQKLINWIWLLHFPFWLYIIKLDIDYINLIYIIPLNSFLGEILLSIIFRKFGGFKWFVFNTISYITILFTFYLSGNNDFFQIIIIVLGFGASAFISAIGLQYGFLKNLSNTLSTK